MLAEAERVFPDKNVSLVVSIGSEHLSPIGYSQSTGTISLGMGVAMDSGRVAENMQRRFQHTTDLYFRFNVEQGLQHIGLTSRGRFSEVAAHTYNYIRAADQQLKRAVSAFLADTAIIPATRLKNVQLLRECPPPSSMFTGREDVLTLMHNPIFDHPHGRHIFILYGLGGAGKTQLALKFAEVSDVIYVDATPSTTIQSELKNTALAKKIGNTANDAVAWLAGPRSQELSFFPPCAHGNIIITTRNRQAIVHARPGQAHCKVSSMSPHDAKQLLLAVSRVTMGGETEAGAEDIAK
ncbi:hypothetical protein FRC07_007865, partial [Ceratobasidium sp. 392]